jgi:hypothetical protein
MLQFYIFHFSASYHTPLGKGGKRFKKYGIYSFLRGGLYYQWDFKKTSKQKIVLTVSEKISFF